MTFSVLLADRESLVAATASCVPGVGRTVPHVRPGVGAVLTQAEGEAALATATLDLLADGLAPDRALQRALSDRGRRESRQVAVLTPQGARAVFTGDEVHEFRGAADGPGHVVCGNLLAGPGVVPAMAGTLSSEPAASGPLLQAALVALRAGEAAGGDARGRMSAALRAHGATLSPLGGGLALDLDVRIDHSPDPLRDLGDGVANAVDYQVVEGYASGALDLDSPQEAGRIARELAARGSDAGAAVAFCRAVVADRLGQVALGERLAREIVAGRPGDGASPAVVDRLWARRAGPPPQG